MDLRHDAGFEAAVAAAEEVIYSMAKSGVPDARMLAARTAGWNNLQGHAHSIVPLAVLLVRRYPSVLTKTRRHTDLGRNMANRSTEARDTTVWSPVQAHLKKIITSRGTDIISETIRSGRPQSIADIAHTYLSRRYGGGQSSGGAGDTVLKRTLKLLAHAYRH